MWDGFVDYETRTHFHTYRPFGDICGGPREWSSGPGLLAELGVEPTDWSHSPTTTQFHRIGCESGDLIGGQILQGQDVAARELVVHLRVEESLGHERVRSPVRVVQPRGGAS